MRMFIRVAAAALAMQAGAAFAFGAIAVDDNEGSRASEVGYGVGFGDSRREAEREALRQCRASGNRDCRVAVWFETCGAYASSRRHAGIGWGRTLDVARDRALEECGDRCRIIVSDCE